MERGKEGKQLKWQDRFSFRNIYVVVLGFSLFILIALWSGLHYKINEERANERNAAIKETVNFARVFEEHTLRTIRGADQAVLFLKYEYEREGKSLNIPHYVAEGRFSSQPFVLMGVIDENGDFAVSSQVPFVPSNLKDREHFWVHTESDSTQLFISKPVLGRSSGKWSLQMTRRINKPDGTFGGVVVVSVDPFYFTEFYKEMDLGKNSSVTLVGLDGVIRARQTGNNSGEIGQNVKNHILLERLQQGNVGSFEAESPIDHAERIYSYRRLQDYPLAVLVGIDAKEYMAPFNRRVQAYNRLAWLISGMLVLFTVGIIYATKRRELVEEKLKSTLEGLEVKVEGRTYELRQKNRELEQAYNELKSAQAQVIHQEKMASIGQLAAGIAHEINNPLGFIMSNFSTLKKYIFQIREGYDRLRVIIQSPCSDTEAHRAQQEEVVAFESRSKLSRIIPDIDDILTDIQDGLQRVEEIVKALRFFSRIDQQGKMENYDLNEGVRNTLIVSRNEIKYVASVETRLMTIPTVQAVGGQINQVLLNIILNAVYAIKDKTGSGEGKIVISTYEEAGFVVCSVADNGGGIPSAISENVFNPFFTTKPVGQGTGLGLSISYDIIVNKHGGKISFISRDGEGTTFFIHLPKGEGN